MWYFMYKKEERVVHQPPYRYFSLVDPTLGYQLTFGLGKEGRRPEFGGHLSPPFPSTKLFDRTVRLWGEASPFSHLPQPPPHLEIGVSNLLMYVALLCFQLDTNIVWPLDQLGNHLILLAITNHKDCDFQCEDRNIYAKVMRVQSLSFSSSFVSLKRKHWAFQMWLCATRSRIVDVFWTLITNVGV